jgi:hypothetical protein
VTRKQLCTGCLLVTVACLWANVSTAQASSQLVSTPFHVQVPGPVSAQTTLWVAYGPVAGKFGIIRLHASPSGQFVGSARFPAGSRATFYYIEGQGTVHTRAGLAPGNPTRTLGRVGPLVIGRQPVPLFRAAAPRG